MVWLRLPFIFTISSLAVALSWNLSEVPGGYSDLAVYDGADDWFIYDWEVVVRESAGNAAVAKRRAMQVAKNWGLVVTSTIDGSHGWYPYNTYTLSIRSRESSTAPSAQTLALIKDRRVKWAEPNIHSNVRWRVCVDGGYSTAMQVARDLGFVVQNRIGGTLDTYTFILRDRQNKSITPSWYTVALSRAWRVAQSRVRLMIGDQPGTRFYPYPSYYTHVFNDEYWPYQWYMQYPRGCLVKRWKEDTDKKLRMDMNILSAYAMGYNGRGVRISVLDDGIEHTHTDLRDNYDPEISWDFIDNDPDPTPDYTRVDNRGTRIAGQIAMIANNHKCGVGVAWGAKVGGVRMHGDNLQSDSYLAKSISYACDKVDIYVIAWGPADDGRTVYEPQSLSTEAMERCISEGRGGKGAIYVYGTGNGGFEDDCNCDGLSSNIYTISIGSVNWVGDIPPYGEQCESTLAVAYSSDFTLTIATTDTSDSCTLNHTGTSAAAPLAAGIIALALQANPHLRWRDVQHLIVWTSEYVQLFRADSDLDYVINGAGLRYHPAFGFGVLNAGALVAAALNWTTVPDKHICRVEATFAPEASINSRIVPVYHYRSGYMDAMKYEIPIDVKGCIVNYIEHVQLSVTIEHPRRGAINLILESPRGTIAEVLRARPNDNARTGFNNWNLTSVATWGENSNGVWKVRVKDADSNNRSVSHVGIIWRMSFFIHGTKVMPAHMKNGRRTYKYQFNNYHYQEEKEENEHGANNVAEVDIPTEENEHGANNKVPEENSPTEKNEHGANNNVPKENSPTEKNEHGANNNVPEQNSPTEKNEHGVNNVPKENSPTEKNEHGANNNVPEENSPTQKNEHGANNVPKENSPTEKNEHGANNVPEENSPTEKNEHGVNNVPKENSPTEKNEHGANNNVPKENSPTEKNEHGANNNVPEENSPTEKNEHYGNNNVPEQNSPTEKNEHGANNNVPEENSPTEKNGHGANNNVPEQNSPTQKNEHGVNNVPKENGPTEKNEHGVNNNVSEENSPTEKNEHAANNVPKENSPTEKNEHGTNNVAEQDSPTEKHEHGTNNNLPEYWHNVVVDEVPTEEYYDDELYGFE